MPEPYGQRRVAGYAIEKSLPDAVGAFVHWLLTESGWTVTERTTRDELPMAVPIEPRHVCILFRRFLHFGDDVTRPYVEALEARGVPHLLVGGKSFHDREEVETMRAALAAIEWPDDELSVFATLRGALFALDDETLLEYRHRYKAFHPFRVPGDVVPELRAVADALELLRRLHSRRNYRPVADTITQLLNATRAHVAFVLRTAGEQSLANVLHVAELARQYEVNGGMSFRGFVEELHEQADGGQAAEAPILEEGSDGVRLMTVHKAKGLEFPVVILADMTAKLRNERADRLIDRAQNACYLRLGRWTPIELATNEALEVARDEAEGVRVAYVAATRARDLLVVPAVGDVAWDGGWTSPLNGAIYPEPSARRSAVVAPRCPPFTKDSVRTRPDNDPSTPTTVCPGQHVFATGDGPYSVVWWDPHALDLDVEPAMGIRRETLIMKDVPDSVVADGLREYEKWRTLREGAIARGSAPSLAVRTATEWAASDEAWPAGMTGGATGAGDALRAARAVRGRARRSAAVEDRTSPRRHRRGRSRARASGRRALRRTGARDAGGVAARRGSIRRWPRWRTCRAAFWRRPPTKSPRRLRPSSACSRTTCSCARARGRARRLPSRDAGHLHAAGRGDRGGRRRSRVRRRRRVDRRGLQDRSRARGGGEDRYRRQVALYASAIAQATGQTATGVLIRIWCPDFEIL